jgi:serine/threonine protein phosphatase PrpC
MMVSCVTQSLLPLYPDYSSPLPAIIICRKLGGFVCNNRTNGVLAVSRSLGDCESQPFVTCDPYVVKRTLTLYDAFVILGCDGVWDVLTDQEAVDLVLDEIKQYPVLDEMLAFRAATRIRDTAYLSGSTDNISVILVLFPQSLEHCKRIRPFSQYGKHVFKVKKK